MKKIVIIVILIAFVSVGISSYDSSDKKAIVKIGDSKIYWDEFESEYQREIDYIRSIWGNIDESQLESLELRNIVLRDMINGALLDAAVEKIGLDATDAFIIAMLKESDIFHNDEKIFDRDKFIEFLQSKQLSEKSYIARAKKEFLRMLLSAVFMIDDVNYANIASALYKVRMQKRSVDVFSIPYTKIVDIKSPEGEDLKKYYDIHKKEFVEPESRDVRLFFISGESLLKEKINQKDVEAEFYNMELDKKFTIKYLVFDSKEDAEIAMDDIDKLWKRGDVQHLVNVAKTELPFAIQSYFSTFEVGKISSIISTDEGFFIVLLEDKRETNNIEKAKYFDEIRKSISDRKKSEAFDEIMSRIKSKLDSGITLEEISSKEENLKMKSFFDVSYTDSKGIDDKALHEIFTTKVGIPTDFYEDNNGNYYAVEIVKINAEHVKDFEKVKDLVEKNWKSEQKFIKGSTMLVNMVRGKNTFLEVNKKKELFVNPEFDQYEASMMAKTDQSQGYKAGFLQSIFNLKDIGDFTSPMEDGSVVFIAVLRDKIFPSDIAQEVIDENNLKINSTINNVIYNSLIEEFINYITKNIKVELIDKSMAD